MPLDRDDPQAGTTEVAFAVVPHTDTSQPGLGTIVPSPGGPGESAIDLAGSLFAGALEPLLDRRDLLLVDSRGVGRSQPITCPALAGPDDVFAGLAEQRRLIGQCGQELGARVGDYGTPAVADDMDAVRARLGVTGLDLVGVSYGTYLMPTYAQRHPEHVRTITLAGAYAVDVNPVAPVTSRPSGARSVWSANETTRATATRCWPTSPRWTYGCGRPPAAGRRRLTITLGSSPRSRGARTATALVH